MNLAILHQKILNVSKKLYYCQNKLNNDKTRPIWRLKKPHSKQLNRMLELTSPVKNIMGLTLTCTKSIAQISHSKLGNSFFQSDFYGYF